MTKCLYARKADVNLPVKYPLCPLDATISGRTCPIDLTARLGLVRTARQHDQLVREEYFLANLGRYLLGSILGDIVVREQRAFDERRKLLQ